MLTFIVASVFLEVILILLIYFNRKNKSREELEKRVSEVVGTRTVTVREQELKVPFFRRVVKPVLAKASHLLIRMLPAEKETELNQKIIMAGASEKIAPRELLVVKYLAAAGIAFLLWMLGGLFAKDIIQTTLMGATGLGLGWVLPEYVINKKSMARKLDIEKGLPDVLDLLTVSVEAGLGFDGAMMKVVEKTKSVLSEEFKTVLQEVKMGKPRAEALRDMSNRTGADDLSTFTGSVILADQLGISIGNILRLQSEQIRQKRRQRAEELALKAPVKILIPLIMFIFPAIFVVLLGPAVIQIADVFLK
ncbi:MAG: type II secretion system F family protein [Peptococcaceae bacterium]|nr:type II secretion system F family protein [Peptococcaceae bacterium]